MKWGKRKSKLSSPSSSSIISRLLHISWLSKLRRNSEASRTSKNKPEKHSEFFPNSNLKRGIRFYSMDEDDPFWSLSFSDQQIPARRSTGGIVNPLSQDLDHRCRLSVSSLEIEPSFLKREESRNFNDMVRHVKRMKERETSKPQTMKDSIFDSDQQSPKKPRRSKRSESEIDVFLSKPGDFSNMAVSKQSKDQIFGQDEGSAENSERPSSVSEWHDLRKSNNFSKEIKLNKPKENGKAKAYSPRTPCKIRALEEMKRTKTEKGKTDFNAFAVLKTSSDPQRDFRDSMVEMIREKGIFHPEDLRDLLACYLGLNSKEYHGIIISAFRRVWFELKEVRCFDY